MNYYKYFFAQCIGVGLLILSNGFFFSQSCGGSFGDPVFTEDFGSVTSPSRVISPALVYPAYTSYAYYNGFPPNDGQYTITNYTGGSGWSWGSYYDHTNDAPGRYGNMLVVNADYTPGEFYRRRVSGLCPNQIYRFSAWILNLLTDSNQIKADVTFRIVDTSGMVLGEVSTGGLAVTGQWKNFFLDFRSAAGSEEVDVVLINNAPGGMGNDLAIDDITFSACGPATTVSTDIAVFTSGVCDNSSNFTITADVAPGAFTNIRFIWQKSTDNGSTWTDISGVTTDNTQTISAGTYQNGDMFRFIVGESTNISLSNCRVASESYTVKILGYPSAPAVPSFIFCQNSTGNTLSVPGSNILWYTSEMGGVPSSQAPVVDTSVAGSVNYWVTQSVNGCESPRSKVTVTILPSPSAPAAAPEYQFCQNSLSTALSATGSNMLWYSSETGGTGSSAAPIPNTSQTGTFSYWVSQTVNGCESDRTEIKVIILPLPFSETLKDTSICDGESIMLDAGDGFSAYEWNTVPPVYSRFLTVDKTGTYSITLTDANGCKAIQTVKVVSGITPDIIQIKSGEDFIEILAEGGNPPYFYSLDNVSWQTSNIFANLNAGVYEVFVKSQANSCTAVASAVVIFIPNVITPNDDGKNDVLEIQNIEHFPDAVLTIFDRYGQQVFTSQKSGKMSWDGKLNGRTISTDTYWYYINLGNGYSKSGWILVKNRN
ncbi:MAG: gliding motility-associated C-terminal domain-containing protein [Bergeyella sp.]